MLVAKKKNGETFSLGECWQRNELHELRATEKFFCPICGENVILKLGEKRIWHFSHQKNTSCPQNYERESTYHLAGKLQLYQWLTEKGMNAVLEEFVPRCRQRADITFIAGRKKYAIEYQCSPISEALFTSRTEGYLSNGITPIWIMGGNQVKRIAANVLSFNHFHYLFLKQSGSNWLVPAYCPELRQFIFLFDALPISAKKILISMETMPRSQTDLFDILYSKVRIRYSLNTWIKELRKLKTSYFIYPNTSQTLFLKELYNNRLNLQTLPPEIGLPVFSAPFIETSPVIWQTYLYLDIFRHLRRGNIISFSNVYHAFLLRMKKKQIIVRIFPLLEKGSYLHAIQDYLTLLVNVSRLRKLDGDRYEMICPFIVPKTVDEQLEMETAFYHTFEKVISFPSLSETIKK
jgi:competence protein CoiA